MNIAEEFERQLKATGERLGIQLTADTDELRQYAAARMLHLSAIVDEPGYTEALVAEGMNVALKAAGTAVDAADAVDRELLGFVTGALAIGARALA